MYQVAIVEDNPMVAMVNRGYTEKDSRFRVAREFRDGRAALTWLLDHPVDLVILDMYMPVFTGLELLRALRARGVATDVIMVTAANDAQTVDALLKLGVTDYLVKPFTLQRFQQALDTFCQHRAAVEAGQSVSQSEIDRLLSPAGPSAPKGVQEKTLERIRACLRERDGLTSEEIAALAGLSAVTVRRYMNYMVESGEASGAVNYDTGGRPSTAYRLTGT